MDDWQDLQSLKPLDAGGMLIKDKIHLISLKSALQSHLTTLQPLLRLLPPESQVPSQQLASTVRLLSIAETSYSATLKAIGETHLCSLLNLISLAISVAEYLEYDCTTKIPPVLPTTSTTLSLRRLEHPSSSTNCTYY